MTEKKLNKYRWWRGVYPNRKYKDRLFQRVFRDKKDLLDLYNAINHTSYDNPDDLEITTLEDVIYLSMKNDMSFVISSAMNLYEQQSTFNPNMPVRGFIYFARLYEAYINKHQLNVYGHKQVKLPKPQFVVFYNGQEEQPDELELKLSDAFMTAGEAEKTEKEMPVLECRARMLNINLGHNKQLLDSCNRLKEYSCFIAEVNNQLAQNENLADAINRAIDVSMEKGILMDVLTESRSEVLHMLLTEYDEKKQMKLTYAEGMEAGMEAGMEEGIDIGREQMRLLTKKLIQDNRLSELERAAGEQKYASILMEEYGIVKSE